MRMRRGSCGKLHPVLTFPHDPRLMRIHHSFLLYPCLYPKGHLDPSIRERVAENTSKSFSPSERGRPTSLGFHGKEIGVGVVPLRPIQLSQLFFPTLSRFGG